MAVVFFDMGKKCYFRLVDSWNSMGFMYSQIGDLRRALPFFKQTTRIFSLNSDGYFNEGVVYFTLKDYLRAIDVFDRCLKVNPRLSLAYSARAKAYFLNKQINPAMKDAILALKLDGQDRLLKKEARFYFSRMKAESNANQK